MGNIKKGRLIYRVVVSTDSKKGRLIYRAVVSTDYSVTLQMVIYIYIFFLKKQATKLRKQILATEQ